MLFGKNVKKMGEDLNVGSYYTLVTRVRAGEKGKYVETQCRCKVIGIFDNSVLVKKDNYKECINKKDILLGTYKFKKL